MLAHLTRTRLIGGNFRTGAMHYETTRLRWSGDQAQGDELNGPVCIVIDMGRDFTMTFDGKLYLTGKGHKQYSAWTPERLLRAAKFQRYGFTLLWDEEHDHQGDSDAQS